MRSTTSCLLLALVALAGSDGLRAQRSVEWWDGPYDVAFEEARRRNVPVLIAFLQDGEEANERIMAGLHKDRDFIELTSRVVPLVASIDEHQETKQEVRGTIKRVCSRFGALPCHAHRAIERHARRAFWPENVVKTPSHIVVMPDGKEFRRLIDVHPTGSYIDAVGDAQKKLGRGLTAPVYRKLDEDLRRISRALGSGKLEDVLDRLPALQKSVAGHPLGKEVDRISERITERARSELESALALAEKGDVVGALRALDEGSDLYEGLPVAVEFRRAEKKLSRTRAGRAASRILARERRWRPLFKKASQYEREADWVRAARMFDEVAERAEGTPLAERAEQRLESMRKDPEIARLVAEVLAKREAARLYREASRLRRAGDAKEAEALLKDIVKRFPDTPSAKKAKRLLEGDG